MEEKQPILGLFFYSFRCSGFVISKNKNIITQAYRRTQQTLISCIHALSPLYSVNQLWKRNVYKLKFKSFQLCNFFLENVDILKTFK